MKKLYTFALLIFLIQQNAIAQISTNQHTISSASFSFSSSSLRLDWTIGEMAATTTIADNGFVFTQGLHQPDKFTVGINDLVNNKININLYPNPAVNDLTLDIIGNIGSNVLLQIFDATGRLVEQPQQINLNQPITSIKVSVQNLAQGAYFVHLSSANKNFRTAISFIKTFSY
jgi:hypothetical protein